MIIIRPKSPKDAGNDTNRVKIKNPKSPPKIQNTKSLQNLQTKIAFIVLQF